MTEQTPQRWIVIPNWDKFQHPDVGRTRNTPWIRNFTEQLSKDEYLHLTWEQRALLHDLRLEYARAKRQLRADTKSLSRRLGLTVRSSQLEALNRAGFIEFSASKPASSSASSPASSSARIEERREENPPTPLRGTPEQRTPRRRSEPSDDVLRGSHQCPRCNLRAISASALTDHLELAHAFDTTPPPAPAHPDPVDLFTNDELTDLSTRLAAAQPEPEEDTWPFSDAS